MHRSHSDLKLTLTVVCETYHGPTYCAGKWVPCGTLQGLCIEIFTWLLIFRSGLEEPPGQNRLNHILLITWSLRSLVQLLVCVLLCDSHVGKWVVRGGYVIIFTKVNQMIRSRCDSLAVKDWPSGVLGSIPVGFFLEMVQCKKKRNRNSHWAVDLMTGWDEAVCGPIHFEKNSNYTSWFTCSHHSREFT